MPWLVVQTAFPSMYTHPALKTHAQLIHSGLGSEAGMKES